MKQAITVAFTMTEDDYHRLEKYVSLLDITKSIFCRETIIKALDELDAADKLAGVQNDKTA